jgi:hypothetical protein
MAEMIPETIPSSSTEGEKRLFRLLERLPDDCLVYFEPVTRRRRPDFIVLMPAVGVLIIEVKDWYLANIAAATQKTITLRREEKSVTHPREQGRGYMHRLMADFRGHPRAALLMQKDGLFAGRPAFPCCHISVLSNINRGQIEREAPDLLRIFPSSDTVTKDELATWEGLAGEALAAKLRTYFDPWWLFSRLTQAQMDVLRGVIHPEIIVGRTETDVYVLDLRQERNANRIGEGHRLIYGVAGSGKTVLLIARAKLLAENPSKRVLMLCYNRLLAAHLAASMDQRDNVRVMTFHGWGGRNGAAFHEGEDDDAFGERLLPHMQNGARDRGRYDAVLIDEAQDWPCSWFQCAKVALREPDSGDLLVVGDGSQSLYRRRSFTWKDAGVHAVGNTINKRFDLDRNYRNTVEILRAAVPFAAKSGGRPSTVLSLAVNPDISLRNGPHPLVVRLDDVAGECHYAAALIESWLRGGIEIRGVRERVQPREIAVLYPRSRPDASIDPLLDRLNGFTRAVRLTGKQPTGTLADDAVRVLSIYGSRGAPVPHCRAALGRSPAFQLQGQGGRRRAQSALCRVDARHRHAGGAVFRELSLS